MFTFRRRRSGASVFAFSHAKKKKSLIHLFICCKMCAFRDMRRFMTGCLQWTMFSPGWCNERLWSFTAQQLAAQQYVILDYLAGQQNASPPPLHDLLSLSRESDGAKISLEFTDGKKLDLKIMWQVQLVGRGGQGDRGIFTGGQAAVWVTGSLEDRNCLLSRTASMTVS